MKKYIIIAGAALVAMCACTKSEPVQNLQKEISFQRANYLSQTKADSDPLPYDQNSTFGVYAWYDSEAESEQDQEFMVNETVAYTGSEWKVSGKTYYWPKTGDVDFFAYAPTAETPWISCDDANHVISTPLTTIAGTEDFMYSDMAMDYNENVTTYFTSGVPVLFHHSLAKLTVNFKAGKLVDEDNEDNVWEITVNQAEITKVSTKGSLSMTMDEDTDTAPEVIGWILPDNSIWTPASDGMTDLQAASGFELTDDFVADLLNEWTVLPQDLKDMVFHINFTIKASNDGGDSWYSTETVDRTYPVTEAFADAGKYWKMNTKITYNVTITPSSDEILFDPAVVDWDTAEGSKDIQF